MLEEILIISIALIGLIIATITDLKYREVPDYLNYFLIASGFSFRFFYSILSNNWVYFLYGLLGFGVGFLIGLLLYFSKQWGGGDAKLLMGLGVIFATKPYFIQDNTNFLLKLILYIFLSGAVYGVFYGVYLAFKHKNKFSAEFKKILRGDKIKFLRIFSFFISLILFALFLNSNDLATKLILLFFILFLLTYVYFWIFLKSIENICMFKIIPVSALEEGDWVIEDIIVNKKFLFNKNKLSVEKKDILRFMREGVKKVKIKVGIPFVPSFLIGTLLSLFLWKLF